MEGGILCHGFALQKLYISKSLPKEKKIPKAGMKPTTRRIGARMFSTDVVPVSLTWHDSRGDAGIGARL